MHSLSQFNFHGSCTTPRPPRAFHFSIRFIRSRIAAAGIYGWPQCELDLFLRISNYRTENDMSKLLSTGSCRLHAICGVLKTGEQNTDWKLKKVLRALHQILHNFSARRNDYADVTGSIRFPLPFCGTWWIEDEQVTVQAVEIWDDICKLCTFWPSLPKSKR